MASLSFIICSLRSSLKVKSYERLITRCLACQEKRFYSQSKESENHSNPLKFTTSNAASWQAKQTRSGGSDDDMPWFQPYVISLSLTVFLVYFCILREENDVDRKLEKSLYDRIQGLEEKQLEISLNYNREHGIDTRAIEKRLEELEQEKL